MNKILKTHPDWYLIDISTPTHPDATMAVDKDVWDNFDGGRVSCICNKTHHYIYARFWNGSKTIRFHTYVLPGEGVCDHIKHGSMTFIDNRRSNLRRVSFSLNNINQRAKGKSGMKGINFDPKTKNWRVSITHKGKKTYLGRFDNVDIAIAVRKDAEKQLYGENHEN